jgi:subtilisin-like proprotein convertase family protein
MSSKPFGLLLAALFASVPAFLFGQPSPRQGPEIDAHEILANSTLDLPDPADVAEFDKTFSQPFPINDGIQRNYVLATDELYQPTTDGVGRIIKVEGVATPSALAAVANILSSEFRLDGRLIVYPAGSPKDDHHRTTLARDVVVASSDPDTALKAARDAGLRLKSRPSYSRNHLILTSDSPGSSLLGAHRLKQLGFATKPLLYRRATPLFLPNDPYFPKQWHISGRGQNGAKKASDAKVPGVWDLFDLNGRLVRGSDITIGIVDDGVQVGGITDEEDGFTAYSPTDGTVPHIDLQENISTNRYNWNLRIADFPEYDPNPGLGDNHGTAVAGVAAAIGYNSIGGTGVAPSAKIAALRLIADAFTDADEAESYDFGSGSKGEGRVHIKNNSWGIGNYSTDLTTFGDGSDPITETPSTSLAAVALKNAVTQQGQIILFAAGNGLRQGENVNYRGRQNSIYVIPVAAVNDQAVQCNYSTPGASIVISAPSGGESGANSRPQGTLTTDRTGNDGYNPPPVGSTETDLDNVSYTEHFNGTSSACPVVAGVTALVLQANPSLNWRDIKEIYIRSATKNDGGDPDWARNDAGFWFNHKYGAGLVNASRAVRLARSLQQNPNAIGTYGRPMTSITSSLSGLKDSAIDEGALIPDNSSRGYVRRFDTRSLGALRVEHATVTVDIDHPDRGELEIELVSPGGTVSRLAETHTSGFLDFSTGQFNTTPRDENANYPNWTFSTVHNWGEDSRGLWTLKVADRRKNNFGLVNSATLTLYGTAK